MIAIEHLLQQPAAQAIGWALLQFVWQGALVGLLSAAALFALRRSAADVRYVVATIGLSLMLTMPVVTALQAWRSMTRRRDRPGRSHRLATLRRRRAPRRPSAAGRCPAAAIVAQPLPMQRRASPLAHSSGETWVRVVLLAWLSGVALLTLRLLAGWVWVQRLRSRGTAPAPAGWQQIAARLSKRLHIAQADPAARVRAGRSAHRDRMAAAGGPHAGERAGRDGAAAARSDPRARAGAHPAARLPREPPADARRNAAVLSPRGLVAVAAASESSGRTAATTSRSACAAIHMPTRARWPTSRNCGPIPAGSCSPQRAARCSIASAG